ncbi:hypothetical protein EJ08DRAFT_466188 [Tothia fuscella]|uniref:Uncharacterized protein n=1 Tax=Tothia fuscella TaxID=1048955 RepID=A0A9P4NZB7_9PEZI|nr:hypothetical protein EJ08DRAFT_466188 [Tothia fuscella]
MTVATTSVLFLAAICRLANAQGFELSLLAQLPHTTSSPIATATAVTIKYDPTKASSSVAAEITGDSLLDPLAAFLSKRTAKDIVPCSPQPRGKGPTPFVDTPAEWARKADWADAANKAGTPSGYTKTFTNLQASNNALGYLGFQNQDKYDPDFCAAACDKIEGCVGINLYFERDPIVDPGVGCENPKSTTNIKCAFWGGPATAETAVNKGQFRTKFEVLIAGSNGYTKNTQPSCNGYGTYEYLDNAAINAPMDCGGNWDTYIGAEIFLDKPFDPNLCKASCEATTAWDLEHPPAPPAAPQMCQFFNTYILLNNGCAVGQYCAKYTRPWDKSYALNFGQYRGPDNYTIQYSYTFSNTTLPSQGCPAPIPPPNPTTTSSTKTITTTSSKTTTQTCMCAASCTAQPTAVTKILCCGRVGYNPKGNAQVTLTINTKEMCAQKSLAYRGSSNFAWNQAKKTCTIFGPGASPAGKYQPTPPRNGDRAWAMWDNGCFKFDCSSGPCGR